MRPTDTPGALAWLNFEIRRFERRPDNPDPDHLCALAGADSGTVPGVLRPTLDALTRPVRQGRPISRDWRWMDESEFQGDLSPLPPGMQFRSQGFLAWPAGAVDERWFVLTRRRALDTGTGSVADRSEQFLDWAAPYLAAVQGGLEPVPPPFELLRIYVVAEDGTFLSLPSIPRPEERHRKVWEEGREFRKRPSLPNFVPNEFFFRFNFEENVRDQAYYSGLYLDLGGTGW